MFAYVLDVQPTVILHVSFLVRRENLIFSQFRADIVFGIYKRCNTFFCFFLLTKFDLELIFTSLVSNYFRNNGKPD